VIFEQLEGLGRTMKAADRPGCGKITAAYSLWSSRPTGPCRFCIASPKRTGWRRHFSWFGRIFGACRSACFARASYSCASCFKARSVSASLTLVKRSLRIRAICALKNLASSANSGQANAGERRRFERSGGFQPLFLA
jgi:hypothetical protein